MGEGVDLFVRFFQAVHGVEPFAWQRELASRVIEGPGWPAALGVPTGLGKTAAIDVAVVALALQASRPPAARTAPTRTFVVVDRRLLVDQAFDRARRIAEALERSEDEAVRTVAGGLRRIGGGPRPLEVVRMRGGVTWSWRWLTSPSQPAVIAATVDQFGSRLLFRGYGVGERLRPIDAALCGTDALLLLDEAHLTPSLVQTLSLAHELERGADTPILPQRAPRTVLLSATLRPDEIEDVLRVQPDVETSQAARRRLGASRRLLLGEVDASGRDGRERLAGTLARLAVRALGSEGLERIAVVANTVATVRAIFEEIRGLVGDGVDVDLLTGRCRGFERERLGLAARIQATFGAVEPRPPRARPAVLVATQTIEVGADLDVDLLITEAAPLDALLQRLGRLNRLGLRAAADAVCVFAPALHAEDVVYRDRVARTWEWLRARADGEPARLDPRRPWMEGAPALEFGLHAVGTMVGPQDLEACAGERAIAPVLLAPHLDAWARTSPAPEPDQPVAPFLHGLDRGAPAVSVCWRAALPTMAAWRAELEALPIREEERVDVPLWAARRFLMSLGPGWLADLETMGEPSEPERAVMSVRGVVQRVDGSLQRLTDPGTLRPGDTIILDPAAGGHDSWGWTGSAGFVPDVADLVPRRRASLRLRPAILAWASGEDPSMFRALLSQREASVREVAESLLAEVVGKARARAHGDLVLGLWIDHAEQMRQALTQGRATVSLPGGSDAIADLGLLIQGRGRSLGDQVEDVGEATTSVAPASVPLSQHSADVGRRAREIAKQLGLPPEIAEAVGTAAGLHDAGKAERRFQIMLHRGDPDRFEASGVVLAKSGMDPGDRAAFRLARLRAELPAKWRHEAVSLAVARRILPRMAIVDRLLVEHLVATHHGSGRPLFPPVAGIASVDLLPVDHPLGVGEAFDGGQIEVDHVDWAGPRRLRVLSRRYGWWGLALLEAIVRLADMAVSEEYG